MKFHLGQTRLWRSKARITIGCAGTGGGKTAFGPYWLAREILNNPGSQFLITAPTYSLMKIATIPTLIKTFENTDFRGRWKEQSHIYEFNNSKLGVIYTISCDNYYQLQGMHVSACWADEAGQYSEDAWRSILTRLGQKHGRCLITTS